MFVWKDPELVLIPKSFNQLQACIASIPVHSRGISYNSEVHPRAHGPRQKSSAFMYVISMLGLPVVRDVAEHDAVVLFNHSVLSYQSVQVLITPSFHRVFVRHNQAGISLRVRT
jgi:hypothetical protein